jgi:hypothetical protein
VLQAHRSNQVSYPVKELNRLAANLTATGLLVDNKPFTAVVGSRAMVQIAGAGMYLTTLKMRRERNLTCVASG